MLPQLSHLNYWVSAISEFLDGLLEYFINAITQKIACLLDLDYLL